MTSLNHSPSLCALASSQDTIGWENFMEGKTTILLQQLQHQHLRSIDSRRSPTIWAATLVKHLLLTVHQLWIYRNEVVHKRGSDGLLLADAKQLNSKIKEHLQTDPSLLLQEDRQLLRYRESLILSWPSGKRKLWLTAVEATQAIGARH